MESTNVRRRNHRKKNLPVISKDRNKDSKTKRIFWTEFLISKILIYSAIIFGAGSVYIYRFKYGISSPIFDISCSNKFIEDIKLMKCFPLSCGRAYTDTLLSAEDVSTLRSVFERILHHTGGSQGGVNILDLHSGAVSHRTTFVNIYKLQNYEQFKLSSHERLLYDDIHNRIRIYVAKSFGFNASTIYLTHPTFYSRITNSTPLTAHDEYWHTHVDKETYPSFHFTSLIYLSDYARDFDGGRLIFENHSATQMFEPRAGRVVTFSSGWENPHRVERVSSGVRYALTVSFTCDPHHSVNVTLRM